MAYGIAINTIFGFKEVTDQKIPKIAGEVLIDNSAAGPSGSFTAPGGVTSSTGFAYTLNPSVFVSMSGTTVNWQFASGTDQNGQPFTLYNSSNVDWTVIVVRYG